ncbi:MAG: hypothetical protein JO214_07615 [Frankiaceae bacterium]|nr:hypothetical protein [Frankiaceae bacterium]
MRILAIDPGSEHSAFVVYDVERAVPVDHGIMPNDWLVDRLRANDSGVTINVDEAVIEWMQPRGMKTSAQEFETLYWIGRFLEAASFGARSSVPWPVHRLTRRRVKEHICGNSIAKDSNVIQALIDIYGGAGGKRAAVGVKGAPGPLHGIRLDEWQALALAISYAEGAR